MGIFSNAVGVRRAWDVVRRLWRPDIVTIDLEKELADLRVKIPAPVFWLFGKTQSGKTSLIRYLTGAEDAAIGNGFRPCTRTSRVYPFPTPDVPVLTFLDTRGVDEPGYDPAEDIAAFDADAHLMVVTCRLTDFAHGGVRDALRKVRDANRKRPVVLALTCLHEPHPQEQHPQPYPFDPLAVKPGKPPAVTGPVPDDVARLVTEQAAQFEGLVDRIVPVDLTRPEEGYADPNYGGEALKRVLVDALPGAYRATFARVTEVTTHLKDLHLRHAIPVIVSYSSLAATAGALPIPFVDLLLLPAIQAKMVHALGALYGQPMTAARFLEAAASLGLGLLARQAVREVTKFIPFVGSAAGAALAWASTYALGRAFCEYFQRVHEGHVPSPQALKRLYQEQLAAAERAWFTAK
jgi:uncharacterized protein (DUF697 family)